MRSSNACGTCHERKVKCDLDAVGAPCSNCKERNLACVPRTRKTYNAANRKRPREEILEAHEYVAPLPPDQTRIVASLIPQPSARTTSIYIGEGGYSTILDMLAPNTPKRRHITVQGAADAALNPEDLEFLQRKGCFVMPREGHELIAAYFRFVHPSFPVLDGSAFLSSYAEGGLERMNLLLLWCIFSVSSAYVSMCSASHIRAKFVSRGKALFDLGGENDKTVLIRAALLLSFWFDDVEDIKQSWYWSGIAFSIAQTLGLDRIPRRGGPEDSRLWRTMWQCCLLRDAWLSYTMGRPLRLQAQAGLPPAQECSFDAVILGSDRLFTYAEARSFETMWQDSITVATTLRGWLTAARSEPTTIPAEFLEIDSAGIADESSLSLSVARRNLDLSQNAALIAMCQRNGDEEVAERAVTEVMATLGSYQRHGQVEFVSPMIVPLLMPAMVHAISMVNSADTTRRGTGEERLKTGLGFLGAIERTFPAAAIAKQLFSSAWENARQKRTA